jgi:Sulfotransferase domain
MSFQAPTKAAETASATPSRLPDFIAVGPPRTGTTWLHRALSGHVGLPAGIKETQFFRWNYSMGLDWYRSFFSDCPAGLPIGEIAPTYFDSMEARERIAQAIPRCRIICSLRDPVDRLYSHYKAWHRAALIEGPFDYARLREQLGAANSYAFNVRAWRETFGADNVLVVLYDDLRADPQAYLDSICAFIGIAKIDLATSAVGAEAINLSERGPRNLRIARWAHARRVRLIRQKRINLARFIEAGMPLWRFFFASGPLYPPLDPDTDAQLRRQLRPEIEELESVLGRDLSAWKTSVDQASERTGK